MNTILSCLRHLDVTENLIMQYCVRNAIPLLTNQKRMQGAFIRCSGLHAGTEVFFLSLQKSFYRNMAWRMLDFQFSRWEKNLFLRCIVSCYRISP